KEHEHDLEQGEKEELSQKLLDAFDSVFGGRLDGSDRYFEPIPISCIIDLNSDQEDREYLNSLALLSEFDLIDLEDVKFKKRDTSNSFYLSQASSGELSLLFTMSSIAGEIEDNSIILIDEPELSLNPEWQLKFLPLLNDIFSNYRHCHFIIATHSP
ncbi:AAA family ATPase, partial [Vibrio parahaemolyticus]